MKTRFLKARWLRTPGAPLIAMALLFPLGLGRSSDSPGGASGLAQAAASARAPVSRLTTVEGVIQPRSTLAAAISGHVPPAVIREVVEAARPLFDLSRVSSGRPFALALGSDGLRAFSYGIDRLQTLHVRRRGGAFQAEVASREYETRTAVVSGVIEFSLFAAVAATGEGSQLALELADIFAWDVDFNTEIQAGDSFRIVFEKQSLDGAFVRYGRVLAAEIRPGGRVLRAFHHRGAAADGYYDEQGRPLRKTFLRSPLRFTRISSRFSRSRLHPVLRVRRPHLAVDYAAPVGTPVLAAADGVVVSAGWAGGYGKLVRLRHANGYETLYGHLSRIQVTRGRRVLQGAPIGAVGRTGLATGPHLDYRMRRNGTLVDPLRIQPPPAAPIDPDERPVFLESARRLTALMSGSSRVLRPAGRPEARGVRSR